MRPLIDLISRLYHKDPAIRYPEYDPDDGKTHLLYVGATLNGTSFYRIMLPAWTLNTTDTHCAIINDLRPWHNENRNIPFSMPFWEDLIGWADYVIFPTIISPNGEFRKLLLEFRRLNPRLLLVMDIDDDYLQPSPFHPNRQSYTGEFRDNLLYNLNAMDMITCTHQRLCDYYAEYLRAGPRLFPLPNLMTCLTEPQVISPPDTHKKASEGLYHKFHIGITCNRTQYEDLLTVAPALRVLTKEHPGRFQITLFGWGGKLFKNGIIQDAFHGIQHQYIPPVLLKDYFATLHTLRYDFAIMPLCDNNFNRMKSNHKLLQYAQMGVPTIAPDLPPYNEPTVPCRPTPVYTRIQAYDGRRDPSEWIGTILHLAEHQDERQTTGVQERQMVLDNYFIEDPKNIKIWQDAFPKP